MGAGASTTYDAETLMNVVESGDSTKDEFVKGAMQEFKKLIAHDKDLAKQVLGQAEQLLHGKTMDEAKGKIDMVKVGAALRAWQKNIDSVGQANASEADAALGEDLFRSTLRAVQQTGVTSLINHAVFVASYAHRTPSLVELSLTASLAHFP